MKELRLKRETSPKDEDWNLNMIQHVQRQNWQPSGGDDLLKITTSSKQFQLSPRVTRSLLDLLLFLHDKRQTNKISSGGLLKLRLNGFVVADDDDDDNDDDDNDDDNSSSCWNQFWNQAIQYDLIHEVTTNSPLHYPMISKALKECTRFASLSIRIKVIDDNTQNHFGSAMLHGTINELADSLAETRCLQTLELEQLPFPLDYHGGRMIALPLAQGLRQNNNSSLTHLSLIGWEPQYLEVFLEHPLLSLNSLSLSGASFPRTAATGSFVLAWRRFWSIVCVTELRLESLAFEKIATVFPAWLPIPMTRVISLMVCKSDFLAHDVDHLLHNLLHCCPNLQVLDLSNNNRGTFFHYYRYLRQGTPLSQLRQLLIPTLPDQGITGRVEWAQLYKLQRFHTNNYLEVKDARGRSSHDILPPPSLNVMEMPMSIWPLVIERYRLLLHDEHDSKLLIQCLWELFQQGGLLSMIIEGRNQKEEWLCRTKSDTTFSPKKMLPWWRKWLHVLPHGKRMKNDTNR